MIIFEYFFLGIALFMAFIVLILDWIAGIVIAIVKFIGEMIILAIKQVKYIIWRIKS